MTAPKVNVLAVCTGNICRSPALERLLAGRLGDVVEASSAGTSAVVGHPISPDMAELIEVAGADPGGFAARQITERMLRGADLVLGLTQRHRSDVLRLAPSALRRCFTLLEFEAILCSPGFPELQGDPGDRLRQAVVEAAGRRSAATRAALDVPDPYGLSTQTYERSFALIDRAVGSIQRAVG